MSTKEGLLAEIKPGMGLTRDFFKRIYGYEISCPGFAGQAIAVLEGAGCSKAREYYESWANGYEAARDAELKKVAHRYRLECEREWEKRRKEGDGQRKRKKQPLTKEQVSRQIMKW